MRPNARRRPGEAPHGEERHNGLLPRPRSPLCPLASLATSPVSDLGQLIVPNSGKPEFGRGEVGAEFAG
jgi:hypothetical protein